MLKHVFSAFSLCSIAITGMAAEPSHEKVKATDSPAFVVYYFYANPRCQTCRAIESNTGKAVQKHFTSELKSGAIRWQPVDVDKAENKHFIQEFKLYTKSVVLVELRSGKTVRHELLQKVWELIHSPEKFDKYIQSSVENFVMKGLSK